MARPTYSDLSWLSSTNNGLVKETVLERMITCLAMLVSRTGPDGTTF